MPKVQENELDLSQKARVTGKSVMIFGDLHLSSTYCGEHINYTEECYLNMQNISERVSKEKPCAVFLTGDIIGVNERNIKDRQFLMRVFAFFRHLNEVTEGNVYTVKGNHDIGDFSDFDLLVGLGWLKNPNYVDFYGVGEGKESFEVRFHFVNYGEESRKLSMTTDENVSNIVIGHNDFNIDGVTNWYSHKGGVDLPSLDGFSDLDLVISGHIHTATEEVLYTQIKSNTVGLIYVGSPARTAERTDDCIFLTFSYGEHDEGNWYTSYSESMFGLKPAKLVFYPKKNIIGEDEDSEERIRQTETLTEIVKEVMEGNIATGDLFHQVEHMPGFNEDERNMVTKYLRISIDGGN